jgi:magnesium-transporting ATPase (P-type)
MEPDPAKPKKAPASDPKTDKSKSPEAKPDAGEDLKSLPLDEVKKKLGFSESGLSQAEAAKRLTQYRTNEIQEKKTNPSISGQLERFVSKMKLVKTSGKYESKNIRKSRRSI